MNQISLADPGVGDARDAPPVQILSFFLLQFSAKKIAKS